MNPGMEVGTRAPTVSPTDWRPVVYNQIDVFFCDRLNKQLTMYVDSRDAVLFRTNLSNMLLLREEINQLVSTINLPK